MHVCFIDDHEGQIEQFRNFLAQKGCDVSYYNWEDNGQSFFAERIGETDLVVVLDLYWKMEMKGVDILRSLRQWQPALPIIVLTSSDNIDDAISMYDRGARRVFKKSSAELSTLWECVKQSSNETLECYKELQAAVNLAEAADPESRFAGLKKCSEIVDSIAEPHVPALHGKLRALQGLMDYGINQDYVPLIDVLKELRDTCFKLYSVKFLDRDHFRSWATACKHLAEQESVARMGAAWLVSLRYDDPLLQDLIQWQVRRDELLRVPAQSSSLTRWLDPLDEDAQVAAHLRLALALRKCAEVIAGVFAESYISRLCSRVLEEATSVIEKAFLTFGDERVVEILASGDPGGKNVSPILMRVVGERVDANNPGLGVLMRTVPLVELLFKWKANLPSGELQHRAATLAFQLYANPGVEALRDRCLAVACQEQIYSGDAATMVLDILAECDVLKFVETYDTWLKQVIVLGKADLSDVLVRWAVTNRDQILLGPAELPLLRRLITTLAQANQHRAAVSYAIQILERSLKYLRIVPKNQFNSTAEDLKELLEYSRSNAEDDALGRLNQLDRQLTAARMAAFEQPGILAGKRMAIVAGTRTGGGTQLLAQYKGMVETHYGASCELFEVEKDNRISALSGAIKGGGYQYVVVVLGSAEHKNAGKVKEACGKAATHGQLVTLVEIPTNAVGARAVLRCIREQLSLPLDELPEN